METEFISTTEAAILLKITRQRVLDFIKDGRLSASKLGHVYMIRKSDLALVADRKTGRPAKEPIEAEPQPVHLIEPKKPGPAKEPAPPVGTKPAAEQGIAADEPEAEPQPVHLIMPKKAGDVVTTPEAGKKAKKRAGKSDQSQKKGKK